MQALLLATGETPKLHPLTADTPAPLLPVANRPVLGHAVELLARQGFKSCVVSLHHHAGQVEAFLQDGARWGLRLDYALQRAPLGDAGALKWAAPQLAETTLLLPGDALLDLDVAPAAQFHRAHGGLLTALVYAPPAPPAHPVWLAPDGRLSLTPLAGPPLALTGAYLVEPALLDAIPPHAPCGLAADLIPRLLETVTTVHAYQVHGYVNPLATFAEYHAAQAAYLDSAAAGTGGGPAATGGGPAIHTLPAGGSALRHPTLDGRRMGSSVWVGKQNVIHPSVRIRPPVCIGDNCRIGRDVELGPHAVVGSHSVIADEATVHASTILPGTYVGRLVDVNGRIVHHNTLIDAATADSTVVADAFLLGPASAQAAGIDLGRVVDAAAAAPLLAALAPLLLLAGLAALLAN
ncbi:MAG: NDP-sugar synthase, partial [Anaerolineales bacterium]|nr:NDP-sugar synthase [Anaerolineales bacterium]